MFECGLKSSYKYWVLKCQCSFWENALLMASDHNLIDFSVESPRNLTNTTTSITSATTPLINIPIAITSSNDDAASVTMSLPNGVTKSGKANKSLFEITRVESHGESVGGDDSELDDTLSETHDSSSTSVLESIAKHSEIDKAITENLPVTPRLALISSVIDITANTTVITVTSATATSANATSTTSTNLSHSSHSEAPSRFRIVKIAKSKPYDKGKWIINDFSDSQKQLENSENSASPVVKRTRHQTESGGDRNKTVTSPSEPVKTKSSEFLPHQSVPTESRGSSYNAPGIDRRSSLESINVTDASTPIVTPMVEALETALGQIQSIKESMVSAVNDEVRKLKESLTNLQLENTQLREENGQLKKKLNTAEERLLAIDKG